MQPRPTVKTMHLGLLHFLRRRSRRDFFLFFLVCLLVITICLWNGRNSWRTNSEIRNTSVLKWNSDIKSMKNLAKNSTQVQLCQEFSAVVNSLLFSSMPCKEANDPPKCASEVLIKPWKAVQRKIEYFRNLINVVVSSNKKAILTKSNTQLGAKLPFGLKVHRKETGVVTKVLYNNFLKDSPFVSGKLYKTCSVVGGSGILLKSSCGKAIDESEFVFRCNIPPIKPFSSDAGTKSNLSTMNPLGTRKKRFSNFKTEELKREFLAVLNEYRGYLWMTAFTIPSSLKMVESYIADFSTSLEKTTGLKIVIQNPEQFIQIQHLLGTVANLNKASSTGLLVTIWALTLCEKTKLYGFWPFSKYTIDENYSIPYHYYNNWSFSHIKTKHSIDQEFLFLLKLHQDGILKIQYGKC